MNRKGALCALVVFLSILGGTVWALNDLAHAQGILYGGSSQVYWAMVKDTADVFTEETGINLVAVDGTSSEAIPCVLSGRCNVGGMARKLTADERMENRVLRETLMAFDSMAVIVPKDCKVKEVSLDVLRQIFSGQISNWEQLKDKPGPIQVIIPRAETTAHANFAAQVLGQNRFSPNSTLVHTAGSVIRAFRGRRAISFGSYGMVSGRSEIAVLKVDGRHPEEKDYPLRQELYFLTAGQPEGAVKRYVDFFLQGRGREFLQRVGMLPASQLERGRD